MQESMSGLVGLLKEKTVHKEDLQAETVHKALQQVLGKQDVGF
jgi:non-canonical (house-cleaning) NTP pyrophosphatase